jgi:hypothetical protein
MHRVSVRPGTETVRIVLRVTADHCDEGEEDETGQEEDFGDRHHELGLAVPSIEFVSDAIGPLGDIHLLDRYEIEESAKNEDHCHPYGWTYIDVPELHHCCYGAGLGTYEHCSSVEICPSECKAKRRVHISRCQSEDAAANGQPCYHLGRAQVARPDEANSVYQVTKEQRERTGVDQDLADSNEQANTNTACDGGQLDMARSKATMSM